MFRDFENNLRHDQVLAPASRTTDTNGSSIDLLGYRHGAIYVNVGTAGITLDSSNYICLELEESADDSTWTDCADADITNAVTAVNTGTFAKLSSMAYDNAVFMTQYSGTKRYIRPVLNYVGTHGAGTTIGAIAFRAGDQSLPVTQAT